MDQKVSLPKPLADFDFDLSLIQELHLLRKKLYRLDMILKGSVRVLKSLSKHADTVHNSVGIPQKSQTGFEQEIYIMFNEINSHTSTLSELLSNSEDIKSITISILELRNQEVHQKNSAQLQRIAEDEAKETKIMSELATGTYEDSRATRVATVIALIYLPASLVLVSDRFNSP
ncbi:MAG: hypothetical protein Q9195_003348 [Heterodermia aff. obscurata]